MVRTLVARWRSVEQWGPMLFLLGGCLMAGHALLAGLRAVTGLPLPPDLFAPTGHLVALVGLLGLYPVFVDWTPVTARIAGTVLLLAAISWLGLSLTQLLVAVGMVSSLAAVLPESYFAIALASTILTYGLFGVTALRADRESRTVGCLVLAPGGLTALLIVNSALGGASAAGGIVIGGGLSLSMLGLGFLLRTWNGPSRSAVPVGEASTG